MSERDEDRARKLREKEFHNEAFAGDVRKDLDRFYSVVKPCTADFEREILERARGKVVLEYGCGPGTHSFRLAAVAQRVVGIDISEVAVEQARARAIAEGAGNTEFHVMDAENLSFPDAEFDLVCGRAIVHHLDVRRCFSTVARVLTPEGAALFHEPLGHNPVINLYRRLTPKMRTVDEHPLLMNDLEEARRHFERVEMRPYVLFSLIAAAFNRSGLFARALSALSAVDRACFALPFLRRYAWTSIWILEGPRPRV